MDLKELYYKGFIVGPNESAASFGKRVEVVLAWLKEPHLVEKVFPFPTPSFEVRASSLLLFRSNRRLPPWIGALTWIVEKEGLSIPILQLPQKKRVPWISEDELIRHEEVHARRACFQEKRFEEILAYRTAASRWRRFLGPLFQTKTESLLFLTLLLPPLFFPWLYFFPLAYLSALLLRLAKNQQLYNQALQQSSISFFPPEKFLECLQDDEILLFAKGREEEIPKNSLRWEQISLLFKRPT